MSRDDTTDKDHLVRSPQSVTAAPRAVASPLSALPAAEPPGRPLGQQRSDLLRTLAQIEDTFQYMGTAHPHYEPTRRRIDALREMLSQLDLAITKEAQSAAQRSTTESDKAPDDASKKQ